MNISTPEMMMPAMGGIMFILAILAIIIFVYLLVAIINNPGLTSGQKLGWILFAFFFPLIALIAYLIIAPGRHDRQ